MSRRLTARDSLVSFLAILTIFAGALVAQAPSINPLGVVNAASFKNETFASGSILSLFGQNLCACPAAGVGATAFPLPTTLGGATVKVGGVSSPLFYVSAGQINFQLPNV